MSGPATQSYYDPYDAAIDRDPHPTWRQLRDEAPLYYNPQHDFYALSRYDDVLAASLDWQTYSSARGTVLEIIDTAADDDTLALSTSMMIFMDPPRHDDLRKLVSRSFTPRRVAALDARLHELCDELLTPLAGTREFDYLEDFAARIPAMMIGALMGVPKADQDQLRVWIDVMMRYEPDGISAEKGDAMARSFEYMNALVEERRTQPRDDMVSDLLHAQVTLDDGTTRSLTHDEVMAFFALLQVAGTETTARLLGWAGVLLARHPEQRAHLRDDRSLLDNAIEELLRYEAPSPIQARFVTHDVDWYGQTVPARSKIALLTGSAGRDERKFADPDRFDVTRTFDRHVTFGYGIHFCLGANLARLEAKVVLEETLDRIRDWEVDEDRVEFVRTSTVRGPSRVPIEITG
jgi:cytochrome P450